MREVGFQLNTFDIDLDGFGRDIFLGRRPLTKRARRKRA
jgi:hypothetical protein